MIPFRGRRLVEQLVADLLYCVLQTNPRQIEISGIWANVVDRLTRVNVL